MHGGTGFELSGLDGKAALQLRPGDSVVEPKTSRQLLLDRIVACLLRP